MRKVIALLALSAIMASCSSSRCGCPTWSGLDQPVESEQPVVLHVDGNKLDTVFSWQ